MVTPQFRTLLVHTCTIAAITQTAGTAGSYGHNPTVTTTTPVVTDLTCRLRPLTAAEQYDLGHASTINFSHTLYIAWEDMPAGFDPRYGPTKYVVTSVVRRRDGGVVDPGPFNITEVLDAAGEGHHAQIRLQRAA